MRSQATSRSLLNLVAAAILAAPAAAHAAQTPASQTSAAQTPAAPMSAAPASATAHPPHTAHRAEVSLSGGLMTVTASNSSLNQVIREIARQTGMHVTGYVAEDRVFGTYGPADPAAILATLLDGTGSNLLIVQNSADLPKQLILTPRTGAATPPDPNAAAESAADTSSDDDAVAPFPTARRGQANPANAPATAPRHPAQDVGGVTRDPAATSPSTIDQTVVFPQVEAGTPPATGTSSPTNGVPSPSSLSPPASADTASPNPDEENADKAAKTPQEIFQELQKLQQKPQP